MMPSEILQRRMVNQQIVSTDFVWPDELVKWQVAMQAQDFTMAVWAIGLRLSHLRYRDIENAFNEGHILRTHIMRPAWHFITPADIRWMLDLYAPRTHIANGFSYRKYELDTSILNRSKDILIQALEGGRYLTRLELMIIMSNAGITVNRMRFAYIMMHAELEKIICSGPRRGKQHTYALFDERVMPAPELTREESLALLAERYFASHGPSTVYDFSWWSGLADKDAHAATEMLGDRFEKTIFDDYEYIFVPGELPDYDRKRTCFLMPDYDEYGISYRNRSFMFHCAYTERNVSPHNHAMVVDGQIAGIWKAMEGRSRIDVKPIAYCPLDKDFEKSIAAAAEQYRDFMEPEKLHYSYEQMYADNHLFFFNR